MKQLTEQPLVIDTNMHGRSRLTASFVVAGERTAVVETGPKSRVDDVLAGLRAAGVDELDWILVTHIHLDHAGAAGTLLRSFPAARVAVHPVGAPHLEDPSKLWASATRIYGERMDELWGGIDPIPAERVTILKDGDAVDLGGRSLRAIETPGHARHHHAFLDELTGALFVGDALGVRLPDVRKTRAATPPPEFDLEDALASIERVRRCGATALWFTHFGSQRDATVDSLCDEAIDSLRRWADWVRTARKHTSDLDEVAALVRERARDELEASLSDEAIDKLEQATSYRMNAWGYMRYLDRKEAE